MRIWTLIAFAISLPCWREVLVAEQAIRAATIAPQSAKLNGATHDEAAFSAFAYMPESLECVATSLPRDSTGLFQKSRRWLRPLERRAAANTDNKIVNEIRNGLMLFAIRPSSRWSSHITSQGH